jgi:ADP-ribosylation factor-like protein 2
MPCALIRVCATPRNADTAPRRPAPPTARPLDTGKQELHELLVQEKLAGASLLVFCNKQDLVGALTPKQIREALDLDSEAFSNGRHWTIQPCSAVTGAGLLDGMDWMVNDISSRIFMGHDQ